jgi:hypothetical protein
MESFFSSHAAVLSRKKEQVEPMHGGLKPGVCFNNRKRETLGLSFFYLKHNGGPPAEPIAIELCVMLTILHNKITETLEPP